MPLLAGKHHDVSLRHAISDTTQSPTDYTNHISLCDEQGPILTQLSYFIVAMVVNVWDAVLHSKPQVALMVSGMPITTHVQGPRRRKTIRFGATSHHSSLEICSGESCSLQTVGKKSEALVICQQRNRSSYPYRRPNLNR